MGRQEGKGRFKMGGFGVRVGGVWGEGGRALDKGMMGLQGDVTCQGQGDEGEFLGLG